MKDETKRRFRRDLNKLRRKWGLDKAEQAASQYLQKQIGRGWPCGREAEGDPEARDFSIKYLSLR